MAFEVKNLRLHLLELNEGQMYGLPKNPTVWVPSERMRREVEEVASLMQVKINIVNG